MCPRFAALFLIILVAECFDESESEKLVWQKPGCHLLGHSRMVKIPGCAPFSVTTNACRGFCESNSYPSTEKNIQPVTSLAQCCNFLDYENVTYNVLCVEGKRSITFESATSCWCFHCFKD